MKRKKSTRNAKNKGDRCFQYELTVALNHKEINRDPQTISKIKPFINECNWYGIKYLSKVYDWKTFEKNNTTAALNILNIKKKEVYPPYISRHNSTREK